MGIEQTGYVSVKPLQDQIGQPCNDATVKKGRKEILVAPPLFDKTFQQLQMMDRQTAVNRYVYHNLPDGITGQYIERMLYLRYRLCFFWMEDADDPLGKLYCLPYSPIGSPDVYGRTKQVTPLPVSNSDSEKPWIVGLTRDVIRDIPRTIPDIKDLEKYTVIIQDYSPFFMSEEGTPRQAMNKELLGFMSEILPYTRTKLISSTGVKGLKVKSDAESSAVRNASKTVQYSALSGDQYVPIQQTLDIEDLGVSGGGNINDFLLAFQTLDNYRLSTYGLKQGGIFDKSQYVNNIQAAVQQSNVGLIYQDGLTIRQHAVNLINAMFGPVIMAKTGGLCWVEPSETVTGVDQNFNGIIADTEPQNGSYEGGAVNGNDKDV